MDIGSISTAITTLGFPIFVTLACGFALWKFYNNFRDDSNKREDKYIQYDTPF